MIEFLVNDLLTAAESTTEAEINEVFDQLPFDLILGEYDASQLHLIRARGGVFSARFQEAINKRLRELAPEEAQEGFTG